MKEKLGEIAYNAYCVAVGGKSVRGEKLPIWQLQNEKLKTAWMAAAEAVANEIAFRTGRG